MCVCVCVFWFPLLQLENVVLLVGGGEQSPREWGEGRGLEKTAGPWLSHPRGEGRQWLRGKVLAQESGVLDRAQLCYQLEALAGEKQPLPASSWWSVLVLSQGR